MTYRELLNRLNCMSEPDLDSDVIIYDLGNDSTLEATHFADDITQPRLPLDIPAYCIVAS